MDWVLQHMEDPDFNDPLPDPAAAPAAQASSAPAAGAASAAANPESVAMLTSFGFNDVQASAALQVRCSHFPLQAFSHLGLSLCSYQ